MATIRHRVYKRYKRADGRYNVKLVVTHKGKEAYFSTNHYVTDKQLRSGSMDIKDKEVLLRIASDESELYKKIADIPLSDIRGMTAQQIGERLLSPTTNNELVEVDFAAFIRSYIEELNSSGKNSTAATFRVVYNNLVDYFGGKTSFPITDVTSGMLRDFELYLRKERVQERPDQFGVIRRRIVPPASQNGLFTIMRNLRVLFNAARKRYNTETTTVITHYPFDYYKMPLQVATRKKGSTLDLNKLIKLRDMDLNTGSREELARDMFMLSFYLCGMNAKDLYEYTGRIGKRLEYERSKTRDRRKDRALISVAIPPEAKPLLEKYNGKTLQRRYSKVDNLRSALRMGITSIGNKLEVDGLTFYHARHLFATLAYNKCGFSKEEIAAALNHVDKARAVTETYIDHDWSVVDKVQSGVLDLVRLQNFGE